VRIRELPARDRRRALDRRCRECFTEGINLRTAARWTPLLVVTLATAVPGLGAASCGSEDAAAGADDDAGLGGEGGDGGGKGDAAGDPGVVACNAPSVISAIGACIDGGESPRKCLDAARVKTPAPTGCDADEDGLDDALEDAMARSYAPVFAFNLGTGDHTSGDSESAWPGNAEFYVERSTLVWRLDNDSATRKVVDPKPTLDSLRAATFLDGTTTRHASDPKTGEGPNFWLCLNQPGGSYDPASFVPTMDASRSLADGVDVFTVVHPSGSDRNGKYVVMTFMLFYPYNKFSFDDHEGDFEGGAVFVDLDTGKINAVYTDRHTSADTFKMIPLEGASALPAKDPSNEAPHYNVCDPTDSASIGGVRFWDFADKRHHPVLYATGGDHASYGYPGATKLQGVGCSEATMVRDVHNGNGAKLVPHEDAYYTGWGKTKKPVGSGVHIRNLGERNKLRLAWTEFAGQWGCTYESIPKSYPGPWDNERLCRHWLTNDWGALPPFKASTLTTCK
jgi:hypothetical protein